MQKLQSYALNTTVQLGALVREVRKEQGLTQLDVAGWQVSAIIS